MFHFRGNNRITSERKLQENFSLKYLQAFEENQIELISEFLKLLSGKQRFLRRFELFIQQWIIS